MSKRKAIRRKILRFVIMRMVRELTIPQYRNLIKNHKFNKYFNEILSLLPDRYGY
jgi:hypothetical protein